MSLSLATGIAMGGLRNTQEQSVLTSRNLAGASTPGYVRKDAHLHTRLVGGKAIGVQVSTSRAVDPYLQRQAREENSAFAGLSARSSALSNYVSVHGQPHEERSVAHRISELRIAFQRLGEFPESDGAQREVLRAAEGIVSSIRDMDAAALAMRNDAEAGVKESVAAINERLVRIQELNQHIGQASASGRDATDLLDERDRLADLISEDIGITTYVRGNNEMVILARGGASLLEGSAVKLTVTPVGTLMAGDVDITPGDDNPQGMVSGRLHGLLAVRNEIVPQLRHQADQLAAGLIATFEAADGSLGAPPSDTGLFTDAGAALDPAATAGLAGRIAVNDLVKPSAGGDLWRLQSGIQATTPLGSADRTQIDSFLGAFDATVSFDPETGLSTSSSIEEWANSLVSAQQSKRVEAEAASEARGTSLETVRLARAAREGVSVDDELQKMMAIEQSYSASARVISVVGSMIDRLLEI